LSNPTLLERHPLLVNLEPAQLERIARAGDIESYNPGEPIVVEGSLGDALFLILSGQVASTAAADVRDALRRRALRRDVIVG
jgi:signal-transduction protein with cAMP-binding, CBS, and nucleotidyltransferase domain